MRFLSKFKIPTILGLGLIIAGIGSGVFLVVRNQAFLTKASPDLIPQSITISNIQDSEVTISWQTSGATSSFVTYGVQNPQEQTTLDERDANTPMPHSLHYVTIKNLQPDTNYLFKITSGRLISEIKNFKTAKSASFQNGFGPIIGTVFDGENPLEEGVVYLSISDATIQSARVKNLGNFLIPISLMRTSDLSDTFRPKEQDIAKLTIIAGSDQSNILFKINSKGTQLPPLKLGQNIDLTTSEVINVSAPSVSELDKFDLNGDKYINAIDYSEVLQNFGKNPSNRKTDFNGDGIVDEEDLALISKKIEGN